MKTKERIKKNSQIFTPQWLAKDMLNKGLQYFPDLINKNKFIYDPACGHGALLIEVVKKRLEMGYNDLQAITNVHATDLMDDNVKQTRKAIQALLKTDQTTILQQNIRQADFLTDINLQTYDFIFQNPPYSTTGKTGTKTKPLWHLFVVKCINMLKQDGIMVAVHPSGWRNIDGAFKKTQIKLNTCDMHYLEIHNCKDGQKTFKASTRYDWYVLQNKFTAELQTQVVFEI